jgi:hypothetical protein
MKLKHIFLVVVAFACAFFLKWEDDLLVLDQSSISKVSKLFVLEQQEPPYDKIDIKLVTWPGYDNGQNGRIEYAVCPEDIDGIREFNSLKEEQVKGVLLNYGKFNFLGTSASKDILRDELKRHGIHIASMEIESIR